MATANLGDYKSVPTWTTSGTGGVVDLMESYDRADVRPDIAITICGNAAIQ